MGGSSVLIPKMFHASLAWYSLFSFSPEPGLLVLRGAPGPEASVKTEAVSDQDWVYNGYNISWLYRYTTGNGHIIMDIYIYHYQYMMEI